MSNDEDVMEEAALEVVVMGAVAVVVVGLLVGFASGSVGAGIAVPTAAFCTAAFRVWRNFNRMALEGSSDAPRPEPWLPNRGVRRQTSLPVPSIGLMNRAFPRTLGQISSTEDTGGR